LMSFTDFSVGITFSQGVHDHLVGNGTEALSQGGVVDGCKPLFMVMVLIAW
jgi:hypothetical protein